ncbi:MAG: hypothetical protein WCR68_03130 [Candidatus Dojkabacteria bacterium]|jgi:hypothetical protein
MSNFEARIQRQKQAIEQERMKKEAEKQSALNETEARDAQRLDRIKNDDRYLQMKDIAYSKQLSEALKHIQRLLNPESSYPIEIHFYSQTEPVGVFHISVVLKDGYQDDEYPMYPKGFSIVIQWRNEPTKRVQTYKSHGYKDSGNKYAGFDAEAGLGIELRKTIEYSESYDYLEERERRQLKSQFFYDLNEFIDYLANLIAEDTIEQENFLYDNFLFKKLTN